MKYQGEQGRVFGQGFQIFASYSREHEDVITTILDIVSAAELVFQDVKDFKPGYDWTSQAFSAIEQCPKFFLFWCKDAAISKNVNKELNKAVELKKFIVPICLDETPLPAPLRDIHAITSTKNICKNESNVNGVINSFISKSKNSQHSGALAVRSPAQLLEINSQLKGSSWGEIIDQIIFFWRADSETLDDKSRSPLNRTKENIKKSEKLSMELNKLYRNINYKLQLLTASSIISMAVLSAGLVYIYIKPPKITTVTFDVKTYIITAVFFIILTLLLVCLIIYSKRKKLTEDMVSVGTFRRIFISLRVVIEQSNRIDSAIIITVSELTKKFNTELYDKYGKHLTKTQEKTNSTSEGRSREVFERPIKISIQRIHIIFVIFITLFSMMIIRYVDIIGLL